MKNNFDKSIAVLKKYFKPIKNGEKTNHIESTDYSLKQGDIARFTNGYNYKNGSVLKEITNVRKVKAKNVKKRDLERGCITKDWLEDYVGKDMDTIVFIYEFKEV